MVTVQGQPIFARHIFVIMVACSSIACYVAVDICICTFITFKRYTGLYFWSMLVLSWSLLGNTLANMTYYIAYVIPRLSMGSFSVFTWNFLVSSQALVLYSRLHLIVHDTRRIRWVPYMIAISLCVLLIPRTILFYCAGDGAEMFMPSYVYHKIALYGLFLQEFTICAIYVREAIRALKPVSRLDQRDTWKVLIYLIVANVLIISAGATILITEFIWFVPTEMSFHAFMCAFKLKLEYFVLNQLCDVARGCHCLCQHTQLRTSNISFWRPDARLSANQSNMDIGHTTEGNQQGRGPPAEHRGMGDETSKGATSGTDITMPSAAVIVDHAGLGLSPQPPDQAHKDPV
jgi:hypothetical protein